MEDLAAFYANKTVLVTGGAGFIGSHLAQALVDAGAHVRILDDLSTGSYNNIKEFEEAITFVQGDVADVQTVNVITRDVAHIFHLAALVSVPESISNPKKCFSSNVVGTRLICSAAKKYGATSLVFSSSSAVYGQRSGLCNEDDQPSPCSPYAKSKLDGEYLCTSLARSSSVSTVCLRYFNVHGPRQNPDGSYAAVVAKFLNNLQTGAPITIHGDGKQTRDFIGVERVVQANLRAGMLKEQCGEVINVASGQSIDLFQLLYHLEQTTGLTRTELAFSPARPSDVRYSAADCRKFEQLLKTNESQ